MSSFKTAVVVEPAAAEAVAVVAVSLYMVVPLVVVEAAAAAVAGVIIFNLVFRRKYVFLTCNNRRYLKYVLGIYFFTNS